LGAVGNPDALAEYLALSPMSPFNSTVYSIMMRSAQ
jgi:hypothetical protein